MAYSIMFYEEDTTMASSIIFYDKDTNQFGCFSSDCAGLEPLYYASSSADILTFYIGVCLAFYRGSTFNLG
jgi:hypothetical protein